MTISSLPNRLAPTLRSYFQNALPEMQFLEISEHLEKFEHKETRLYEKERVFQQNPSAENLDRLKKVAEKTFYLLKEEISPRVAGRPLESTICIYLSELESFRDRKLSHHWHSQEIAVSLWKNALTVITESTVRKVNFASYYLSKRGFQLEGIPADGNCYFNAFLKSYQTLKRDIPLLDDHPDKIAYLRGVVASGVNSENRRLEIQKDRTWISSSEGDVLAKILSVPIRTLTVNTDAFGIGINDMLTFPDRDRESQDWNTLPANEQPDEYIFIVDLGGHFVYAASKDTSLKLEGMSSGAFLTGICEDFEERYVKKAEEMIAGGHIDDAELLYIESLEEAIDCKNIALEMLAIGKLGDVYFSHFLYQHLLDTLVRVAGLFNYALCLANTLHKKTCYCSYYIEEFTAKIVQTKRTLLNDISPNIQSNSTEDLIEEFQSNRQMRALQLKNSPRFSGSVKEEEVNQAYINNALTLKAFFRELVNRAIHRMGVKPPCNYCFINFGSLAKNEATLYSDIEFGILIENDQEKEYFRKLTYLLHIDVINLGETILPALKIHCLELINFHDSKTPRGFAFDGAGAKGKGCKTPLGNRKSFELIQTPEEMAKLVSMNTAGEWWVEKEPHLPLELVNYTLIDGCEYLFINYGKYLNKQLEKEYKDKNNLRVYLSQKHLIKEDSRSFNRFAEIGTSGRLIHVKSEIFRFFHILIDRLALLNHVEETDTFSRVKILFEEGVICKEVFQMLTRLTTQIRIWRAEAYKRNHAQREIFDFLRPLSEDFDMLGEKSVPTFKLHELDFLKEIMVEVSLFYRGFQSYVSGNKEAFLDLSFKDKELLIRGKVNYRFDDYGAAIGSVNDYLSEHSSDEHALNVMGSLLGSLGELEVSRIYLEKAYQICQQEEQTNVKQKIYLAKVCSNLGAVCAQERDFDRSIELLNEAVSITKELFGKGAIRLAAPYLFIACCFFMQQNYVDAKKKCSKAYGLIYRENLPHLEALILFLNGLICFQEGNYQDARSYIERSLKLYLGVFNKNHRRINRCRELLEEIQKKLGENK